MMENCLPKWGKWNNGVSRLTLTRRDCGGVTNWAKFAAALVGFLILGS